VSVLHATHGALPLSVLLGMGAGAEADMAARAAPHHDAEGEDHDHDEFESFVLDLPRSTTCRPWSRACAGPSPPTTCCA
jgi:cobalamin biosynthesis protein CobW